MPQLNISIIGSGNVATHLAMALNAAGNRITQIAGQQITHARALAQTIGAEAVDKLSMVNSTADVILISVTDSSIETVAAQLPHTKALVLHTAGSMSIDALKRFENHGVLYPFQTFTKNKAVDMQKVPIFIEANTPLNLNLLKQLASRLSPHIFEANSQQRMTMHIGAVFACNFANHLYTLSSQLLKDSQLPFELLYPLIDETTEKVKQMSPNLAQTGPAVRGDQSTMDKHLEMLRHNNDLYNIYKLMSQSIDRSKIKN